MIIIRKITQMEKIEFLTKRHSELKSEITKNHGFNPRIFGKMSILLAQGEFDAFMKTKGFKSAKVWKLRSGGKGILDEWFLLSGEAA